MSETAPATVKRKLCRRLFGTLGRVFVSKRDAIGSPCKICAKTVTVQRCSLGCTKLKSTWYMRPDFRRSGPDRDPP